MSPRELLNTSVSRPIPEDADEMNVLPLLHNKLPLKHAAPKDTSYMVSEGQESRSSEPGSPVSGCLTML